MYIIADFAFSLTQDIFVVLGDEGSPVLPVCFLDVNVDETVPRSVQVRVESEHGSLVGDIRVLGVKVVHKFDPWKQA